MTNKTTERLPRIISKKELCFILSSDELPLSLYRLKKYFFPTKVLEQLGLSEADYKAVSTFDTVTTKKIFEVHQISKEEIIKTGVSL